MASIGHVAMGLWASRATTRSDEPRRRWIHRSLIYIGLSMLPDADVIGFAFAVPYESAFGHRGASHSFAFAVLVGLLIFGLFRVGQRPALVPALVGGLVVASHPVLDAFTDGGLGCALLWPLSEERFFWPWRPIPVAPIGMRFFTRYGLEVALVELAYFVPLLLWSLWPRRRSSETRSAARASEGR